MSSAVEAGLFLSADSGRCLFQGTNVSCWVLYFFLFAIFKEYCSVSRSGRFFFPSPSSPACTNKHAPPHPHTHTLTSHNLLGPLFFFLLPSLSLMPESKLSRPQGCQHTKAFWVIQGARRRGEGGISGKVEHARH